MSIEVAVMPGDGAVDLTGRLGDVMKESARTALSYIRSQSDALNIPKDFHKTSDLHIHVPEGAVPKDGPSAGVAITCAMVSAITGRKARQDVAMTGEVTLRGKVLPIGGVKEKLLAAHRMGINIVLLPEDNQKDLADLPADVRSRMDVHLIGKVDQALSIVLINS
jgi:ATP-dependent Lon protease